ncbi:uncharacterized protein [Dermacentor albipictus]|uniref:uncharacterized protein isoform X1 n=2 Tax=Dermacentor albipictus TaxID=60249 RepID=UPI0038FC42F8
MSHHSGKVIFPITGWKNDLAVLPPLSDRSVHEFYAGRSGTKRSYDRSYNFHVESYVNVCALKTNVTQNSSGLIFLKAPCYRSKKKNAPPYSVMVALDATRIIDGSCDCPAGKLACNHMIAVLRTAMLLQSKGFSEAPDQLSCTDLPQQWRIPRRSAIRGCPLQSVDWRKAKEGGTSAPKFALPKERRVRRRNRQEQEEAKQKFAQELLSFDPDNDFAKALLLTDEGDTVQSRFGLVSSLAPQSYQQSLLPHGFTVLLSGLEPANEENPCESIPTVTFFESGTAWNPPAHLESNSVMQEICVTPLAAEALEKDSRQQAKSATWQQERRLRVTSSKFGAVLNRKEWTIKGLQNLTAARDLSRVTAVNYGIKMESLAAQRYEDALRRLGHAPTVSTCGLLVNPAFPWLGASPDRIAYDPTEQSYGVVEIKCPYSLRDHKASALVNTDFCSIIRDGVPELKRDHQYYHQLLGQMGVSQLRWGDFVVYGGDFILIERIRFNENEWRSAREVLDNFYFDTLLPYLLSTVI